MLSSKKLSTDQFNITLNTLTDRIAQQEDMLNASQETEDYLQRELTTTRNLYENAKAASANTC